MRNRLQDKFRLKISECTRDEYIFSALIFCFAEASRKISVSSSYATVNSGKESAGGAAKKRDSYASLGPPEKHERTDPGFGPFVHLHGSAPGGYASYGPPDKDIGVQEAAPFEPFVHAPSRYAGYGPPDKDAGLPEPPSYGPFAPPHQAHYTPYGTSQPGESRGNLVTHSVFSYLRFSPIFFLFFSILFYYYFLIWPVQCTRIQWDL